MSGTILQSSDSHSFMVSRKFSLQPWKLWQSSITAPKLHTKQAKFTVNSAYCITEYSNISDSSAANINTELLEGKKTYT